MRAEERDVSEVDVDPETGGWDVVTGGREAGDG